MNKVDTPHIAYCPACNVSLVIPKESTHEFSCACGGVRVGVRPPKRPEELFSYPIEVRGMDYCVRKLEELDGEIVRLEREFCHAVNEEAIAICILGSHGVRKLGYVPRELADSVKDDELPRYGSITSKGDKPYLYARVKV